MKKRFISAQLSLLISVAGLWSGTVAQAASTDISQSPLASATTAAVVKPNLMFILDDSGSMDWDFLPDGANFNSDRYGNRSSHCNGVYYNPKVTYVPPVDSKGVSFANATLAAAWKNGFDTSVGTVNITSSARYYLYTGTQSDAAYTYNASGGVETGTTFFKECNSTVDNTPGVNVFTRKTIDASSPAAEQTNYANWYSYYRTRMLTMKTAAGRAFRNIDDKYRVGYSTIGYTGVDSTNRDFLKIADFSAAQKELFYSKLYKAAPTHWTPLRPALAKAGRIYAGKLLTGADDPIQYSCQQNFTILSTDGYWNANEETTTYGPYQIDGTTTVGNQDSALDRPMFDGSVATTRQRSTLTVTGADNAKVESITVNGITITSGSTNDSDNETRVAERIAAAISKNGYTATSSGNVVTITAPTSLGAITFTPVVNKKGTVTITATAFSPVAITTGGASNTLADVAAYYYNTDLRTSPNCTGALGTGIGVDICTNNVTGGGSDTNLQQHMTTFTLGLGTNGRLQYAENYLQGGSPDYEKIKQGTMNWPDPISNNGPERIDDLWHTAVNGHGTYFSAQSPDSLVSGLGKALGGVSARTGTAAAAATSNLEPVAGDNLLFLALYRTLKWDGDLQVKTIDPKTGAISPNVKWSAQEKLDAQVGLAADTRNIYFFDSAATGKLKSFIWENLGATEQAYFNGLCAAPSKLSQCTDTTAGPNLTAAQRDMLSGANLVNFLRGQSAHEDQAGNTDRIYRDREHALGDMINSQPVYVKVPPFSYADAGYASFKTAQKDRLPMVYVAANDGMLHAFDATIDQTTSGREKWAYIPPMVMPNLHKLADMNYANNHQYFVDGAPTIGDVCPSMPGAVCTASQWKTILVGGLNGGGKGYYAMDVTDPASPKALWNYTVANDADMGLSFGNPVITKRKDGTWVVVFASGYNNTSGDGKGHLFVLNAYTGALILKLSTTAGDATNPSGLAKINAWVDSTTDNTAKRFYGGDLLGNLWRFDTDDRIAPAGNEATLLAELGNVAPVGIQPITIKPLLSELSHGGVTRAVVSIATGRYLGASDLSDTRQNSVYTIRDDLTATGHGKVRTAEVLVKQSFSTVAGNEGRRTTTTLPVDWTGKAGWYLDLNAENKSPGERVNVDMRQQLGLLTFAGNVPDTDACSVGGYTWLYWLDYKTGQFVKGAENATAGKRLSNNALAAGIQMLRLDSGNTVTVVTGTTGDLNSEDNPSGGSGTGNGARRVSWRELTD
ncbi:MAG: pilY1 [Burkholderia sp.]|nr:pilY1 [Burkholderia sp.]